MDSISIMHKLKGLPLSLFFGPESVIYEPLVTHNIRNGALWGYK